VTRLPEQQGARDDAPPSGEFLAHIYVHRRGAWRIFGAVAVAGLVIAALLPAHYKATASLAVMPAPEFTVRENAGSHDVNTSALAMDQVMKGETEILESDELHAATMRGLGSPDRAGRALPDGITALYPDLAPDQGNFLWRQFTGAIRLIATPWLGARAQGDDAAMDRALLRFADDLRVLPSKDGNVIDVSLVNRDSAMAARALNAMLAEYAKRRRGIYTDPQLHVAEAQSQAMDDAVRRADAALAQFKAKSGFSEYATERDLLLKRRSQATQTLNDALADQAQSQARLAALTVQIQKLPPNPGIFQENDTDTRLQTLDDSLVDLRGHLDAAREHYRDTSRMVTSLRAQIAQREAERRVMARDAAPSVRRAGRSPALDPLLVDSARSSAEREAAGAQAVVIQKEINGLDAKLLKLDGEEAEFADLTRQKNAADESFASTSRIVAEVRLIEAEEQRRLANVRIIQPARIPERATWTKLLVGLAGIVFGAAGAGLWLVMTFTTQTAFLTAAGLAYATGLPVLAVFPKEHAEA
jgi:uncharacterized protein involved in exopolysaccharide biosynthesis